MAAGFADIGRLVATLGLNTTPFTAGMKQATSQMQKLTTFAMVTGRAMTRFITLPMALAGGAAVNTQKQFEASMTKIIGLVGVSREQVEAWNKEVLKMSSATGRGPGELADALYFVTSAGIRGAEAMEVLEMSAKAAASGLGETKVIADLVTSAMNAYGKENLSAAQATDILVASVREGKAEADELAGAMGMVLPIASEFGVSFDQVGAAFAGMTRTGTNARVAATQLKAILSAMASPSMQSADAMAKYGTSAENFRKTVREDGLIKALLDLKMVTEGQGKAMAGIFPNIRALMGVLDLLGANVNYNVKIFEALTNASGSLERAFAEVGGTTQQKLNVALATVQATFVKLGEALKPFVVGVLTRVNDYFNNLATSLEYMGEAQRKAFVSLSILTAAFGPFMLVMAKVSQIIMANPWFALATAIGMAALAMAKWLVLRESSGNIERRARKEREQTVKNIHAETIAINALFTQLKLAKKGTEEWERVRGEINGKYGGYLDNLITEKSTLDEIEAAQRRVTKARMADISIKEFGEQLLKIQGKQQKQFDKKMTGYMDLIYEKSDAVYDKTTGGISQFITAVNEGIQKDIAILGDDMKDSFFKLESSANAQAVYDKFIAPFETYDLESFMKKWFQLGGTIQAFDKESKTLNGRIKGWTEYLEKLVGGTADEIDISVKVGNIDQAIKDIEDFNDVLSTREKLETLISLHQQKRDLFSAGTKEYDAEVKLIGALKEKLKNHLEFKSGLGEEARLEGAIKKLVDDRVLLSGKALEQNSKDLAIARDKLATLQLEKSGYGELEMLRGRITAEQARQLYMSIEEQKISERTVKGWQQQLRYKELQVSGASHLAMLENELLTLQEQEIGNDLLAAQLQAKAIKDKEIEIEKEEERVANLSEYFRILEDIKRGEAKLATLSGEAYKTQQRKNIEAQIEANEKRLQNEILNDIERTEIEILNTELKRMIVNPAIRAQLAGQLDELERQKDLLQEIEDRETGKIGPDEFSGEWFNNLGKRMASLQKLRKAGEEISEGFTATWNGMMDSMLKGVNHYVQMAGNVMSNFVSGMASMIEAQKQRELSAAGDNAKKREEIERKYFEKQQKMAVAQANINMALAIGSALTSGWPLPALVLAGLAAAAGAVQVSAIKAQSFAEGGIVSGPTMGLVGEYAGARSNPEVIAPLDKLKSMLNVGSPTGIPAEIELRARGPELYAVLKLHEAMRKSY